jgi:hypothetical protein
MVNGQWAADSPLGRVAVAFVDPNDLGVADHDVTLPSGERVTNPMRVFANGDGCDAVFSVRRPGKMSEADFAADVDAVPCDLASLRSLMETRGLGLTIPRWAQPFPFSDRHRHYVSPNAGCGSHTSLTGLGDPALG